MCGSEHEVENRMKTEEAGRSWLTFNPKFESDEGAAPAVEGCEYIGS